MSRRQEEAGGVWRVGEEGRGWREGSVGEGRRMGVYGVQAGFPQN